MAVLLWGIFGAANMICFVFLFFILAIVSRQVNNLGMPFNKWLAFLMLVPYFIVDKYAPLKYAVFVGLIGGIAAGFLGGMFMGGDEEGGDE